MSLQVVYEPSCSNCFDNKTNCDYLYKKLLVSALVAYATANMVYYSLWHTMDAELQLLLESI